MSTNKTKISASEKSFNRGILMKEYVYSLQNPQWYCEDIVDAVFRIMDEDGPQPMWNGKSVQTKRNGADKFYQDHQEEYEARGKQSCSKVSRVNQHNKAFPKMHDELDRRQSIANVKAIAKHGNCAFDQMENDPKCSTYGKLKIPEKGSDIKPTSHKKSRKKSRLNQNGSRVRKPRRRNQKKIIKSPCKTRGISITSASCQYSNSFHSLKKINRMTSAIFSNFELIRHKMDAEKMVPITPNGTFSCVAERGQETVCLALGSPKCSQHRNNESRTKTDTSSRNPGTSQPSLSSYTSYMSMDHEPMD